MAGAMMRMVVLTCTVLRLAHAAINCTEAGPALSAEREAEFLGGVQGLSSHADLPGWLSYGTLLWLLSFAMGLGKGGAPGVSTSSVAFNALYAPDGCLDLATSLQVPVTVMADVAVVINFYQDARWDIIIRLLPGTGIGLAIGSQLVGTLGSSQAKILVGSVLSMILIIGLWQDWSSKASKTKEKQEDKPAAWATSHWFAFVLGSIGGFATILTNSMGPMLNVFLLTQKLEPASFVGTRATFFTAVNVLKISQRVYAGTLTSGMITIGSKLGLLSVAGVLLAKMAVRRMSKSLFSTLQYIALSYSSYKLLSSGLLN